VLTDDIYSPQTVTAWTQTVSALWWDFP